MSIVDLAISSAPDSSRRTRGRLSVRPSSALDPRPEPLHSDAPAAEALAERVRGCGMGEAEPVLRLVRKRFADALDASRALLFSFWLPFPGSVGYLLVGYLSLATFLLATFLLATSCWLPSCWLPSCWLPSCWLPSCWLPSCWRRLKHPTQRLPAAARPTPSLHFWRPAHEAGRQHRGRSDACP